MSGASVGSKVRPPRANATSATKNMPSYGDGSIAAKALTARNSQRILRRQGSRHGMVPRASRRCRRGWPGDLTAAWLTARYRAGRIRATAAVSPPLTALGYKSGASHDLRALLLPQRGDEFRLRLDAERDSRPGGVRPLLHGAARLDHARRRHARLAALFDAALLRRGQDARRRRLVAGGRLFRAGAHGLCRRRRSRAACGFTSASARRCCC